MTHSSLARLVSISLVAGLMYCAVLQCAEPPLPPPSPAPPGKLYFTIFHWSSHGFKLPTFKNEIKQAYFLDDPDKNKMLITDTVGIRVVQTPHYAPNEMATVLVVEINGHWLER